MRMSYEEFMATEGRSHITITFPTFNVENKQYLVSFGPDGKWTVKDVGTTAVTNPVDAERISSLVKNGCPFDLAKKIVEGKCCDYPPKTIKTEPVDLPKEQKAKAVVEPPVKKPSKKIGEDADGDKVELKGGRTDELFETTYQKMVADIEKNLDSNKQPEVTKDDVENIGKKFEGVLRRFSPDQFAALIKLLNGISEPHTGRKKFRIPKPVVNMPDIDLRMDVFGELRHYIQQEGKNKKYDISPEHFAHDIIFWDTPDYPDADLLRFVRNWSELFMYSMRVDRNRGFDGWLDFIMNYDRETREYIIKALDGISGIELYRLKRIARI